MSVSAEITKQKLLQAMADNFGIVTTACKKVGVVRQLYYYYYDTDPKFKAEIDSLAEMNLDFVETELLRQIADGNTPATIFFLKSKGKKRGYSDTSIQINNTQLNQNYSIGNLISNDDELIEYANKISWKLRDSKILADTIDDDIEQEPIKD